MSAPRAVIGSQSPWYLSTARFLRLALVPVIMIGTSLLTRQVSTAQTSWQWYKTDLHAHSVISAEAFNDLGIMSRVAKSLGYNALFLTDHNLASSFPISSLTANYMVFEDSYTRWTSARYGSPTSTTNTLTTTPVNTGTKSLRLASSASAYAETYVWTNRGPNFRSGDIILKFSVYPTRIDPGSGVYVSASIGGDVTVQNPDGYTTSGGVISPGKSIVMVWQLGSARAASSDMNRRVLTYPLTYTLNAWNHYTINISDYLADIPATERPLDYNAVTYLKMAAAANAGTADAYFDAYSITASAPVPAADEFVYRTSVIGNYDTSTFKIFPSLEMGVSEHAQRFNFGITHPSEFLSYWDGVDGILPAQESGYPAMLNHPGSSGGVSDEETINTQGRGADLMEVRQQGWIDNWDAILQQGVQILGTGTSDTHRVFSGSSFATYVYGPELTFDSLIRSIFEGRTYVAAGSFGDQGRLIFNVDGSSQEPYPARYPVYVPGAQSSANVHLFVTGGLQSGYTIRWLRNGIPMATDNTAGVSYETSKAIPLDGAWTYVRAEVRDSGGALKALTQPIFFITAPGLPADMSYYIDSVNTADGRKYTKLFVKGIAASSWDEATQVLTLALNNPANTLIDMRMTTGAVPQTMQADGVTIPVADSLATYENASGSMWFYDDANGLLYLKVLHGSESATVTVGIAKTQITPTVTATNTATSTPTGTPTITATNTATYTPTMTATNTSTYTPARTPTVAASLTPSGLFTFTPVADSYISASHPTTNYGSSTALLTSNSPIVRSYLRFHVQGLNATIKRATLRIFSNTSSNNGYIVSSLKDTSWGELTINYNNAVSAGAETGSSGPVTAGTWTAVDLTPYISDNSLLNLVLTTTGSTELRLSSREAIANAPKLIIETVKALIPTSTFTSTATQTDTLTPVSTGTFEASSTPSQTSTAMSQLFTFVSTADAYVNEGSPITNYGLGTALRADATPLVRSYLRFDIQGLSGSIRRATLRVFTNSSSSTGYEVRNVADNAWSEGTINHTNAPAMGGVTATSGSFGAGVWTTVDITPLVTGNGSYNFALTTTSGTAFSLASREAGVNAPQLVIEIAP